jgi:O-methyltransferase
MAQAHPTLDERLYAYLLKSEPPEHEELRLLRERTRTLPEGRMQIAREQAHFLAFLVRLIGAGHILELGTFTGYSALAMALALPSDGKVVTCDVSESWTNIARCHWERAGLTSIIDVRIGPATKTLDQLEQEKKVFDLIFIDADKESYDSYYEAALRLVQPTGLIVLDNMFRLGRVANPAETDPDPISVRMLNAKIAQDERVDRVILPVADGMTLVRLRSFPINHTAV